MRRTSKRVKQPNGAGSIVWMEESRRCQGRYTARDPETGLSVRKAVYGRTEQECRARLIAALQAKADGALPVTKGRVPTLGKYAEEWLEYIQTRSHNPVRPSTAQRYSDVLAFTSCGR